MGLENAENFSMPSWAAWLDQEITVRGFSPKAASRACGLPESTLAVAVSRASRHSAPRPATALAVAHGFHVLPLCVAVIGGIGDSDPVRRALIRITSRIGQQDGWWSKRGGEYIQIVRETQRTSVQEAVDRWNKRWPMVTLSSEDWEKIETDGLLPNRERWAAPLLEQLPGAWLAALISAIAGNEEDIIAMATVCGPLLAAGPDRRIAWAEHAAEEEFQKFVNNLDEREDFWRRPIPDVIAHTHSIPWTFALNPSIKSQRKGSSSIDAEWEKLHTAWEKLSIHERKIIQELANMFAQNNQRTKPSLKSASPRIPRKKMSSRDLDRG